MKTAEIRAKNPGERAKLLVETKDKVRKLRFDLALREAKNHSDYRKMKKDIARLLTVAQEDSVLLDEMPKTV